MKREIVLCTLYQTYIYIYVYKDIDIYNIKAIS